MHFYFKLIFLSTAVYLVGLLSLIFLKYSITLRKYNLDVVLCNCFTSKLSLNGHLRRCWKDSFKLAELENSA